MVGKKNIMKIQKRNGTLVDFEQNKITRAIFKALKATNKRDLKLNRILTDEVVKKVQDTYKNQNPTVEQIQDLVEEILITNKLTDTAKAYILYRQKRTETRKIASQLSSLDLVDNYLKKADWRIRENSNQSFSLQGLNNFVSSIVIANYWLHKVYPSQIAQAHESGDLHIHDLSTLGSYCVGWDLRDLLVSGFGHVPGKIESGPAKHLRTALGQVVNFFFTLQGEAAGAQAFSNFDIYLSPFIRHDKLNYKQVKQVMQEFIFSMNVPTRVGFQCMSEDTEILTPDGWVNYHEIEIGNTIKTFNINTAEIEDKRVQRMFKRFYDGKMYNLKNRIQDQLISPKHRIVRRKFNTNNYVLEEIESASKLKSPFIIPIAGTNKNKNNMDITDTQIKLLAWVIADGSSEKSTHKHRNSRRISIYQSKIANPRNYEEIITLLNDSEYQYTINDSKPALGNSVKHIRMNQSSSQQIHTLFEHEEDIKFIPKCLLNMSKEQSRLFLTAYLKADGHENSKITTTDIRILEGIQQICVNAEWGFTVATRNPTIGNKLLFILRIIKHKETYIQKVKEIDYQGVIWCPTTDNNTVIAKRNGKVFITGNTPFTNITLDMIVPEYMKDEPVIIGGKPIDSTYGDYQPEVDMFNKAFNEIMNKGDAKGRVFTFPIPTINITKDFDWDKPIVKDIMKLTGKYGIYYFSNFVNSDMKPEDTRSMCPLASDTEVLVRSKQNGVRVASIIDIINNINTKNTKYEVWTPEGWKNAKPIKVPMTDTYEITLSNGNKIRMGENHLQPNKQGKVLKASELEVNMWLPHNKDPISSELGNKELGIVVGIYLGDGSKDDDAIVHSLNIGEKDDETEKILREFWETKMGYTVTIRKNKQVRFVRVNGNPYKIISRYIKGENALEKQLTKHSFAASIEFKEGLIEGFRSSDGSREKNRLYTSSSRLRKDIAILLSTIGKKYLITYVDNRENRLGENPNYRIDYPERTSYGEFFTEDEEYNYYRIVDIKKDSSKGQHLYCFEVENKDHLFMLANGLITHNCRLRLDNKELRKRGGGLFGANPLTGSIGVVTINLPRIGYLAKDDRDYFERLDTLMDFAKESLEIKRKLLERFTEGGLYPYSRYFLRDVKLKTSEYWNNHFSTIGIIGMNESLMNYMGSSITQEDGRKFATKVMDHINNRLRYYQESNGNNMYNFEATPAEGTSYRLARLDTQKYQDIFVANDHAFRNEGASPFYTNSTQLPVDYTSDLFEALNLQDELQTKYSGGTVFHAFMGEKAPSWQATRDLVKSIAENFKLPYYTITPTFSICPNHGYIQGEHEYCPKCDEEASVANINSISAETKRQECEVYSRIVGYLRPVKQWNDGKKAEFTMRTNFDKALQEQVEIQN
ncbi:MAG: anaerobic ribonucleoside-triphosphate reductase [Candidatus Ranarchaeia archaeon]